MEEEKADWITSDIEEQKADWITSDMEKEKADLITSDMEDGKADRFTSDMDVGKADWNSFLRSWNLWQQAGSDMFFLQYKKFNNQNMFKIKFHCFRISMFKPMDQQKVRKAIWLSNSGMGEGNYVTFINFFFLLIP